ncbi:ribokinase [Paenibacillus eucommiae]|uniref:Ribokinase n=1 Tax=Paenibacillus eucommiae TaxID=1355755 RepID=A0ABS4J1R5_9BACL|nr:ribokinase [Paenibacillus eucommiae]MBP1993735.1 ribokinase [Paenibacillus eucommiae]
MKNEIEIVVFGTLNMDFVTYVDHLPGVGETIAASTFSLDPGGKAANQAVAASRLGCRVAMVGRIGDDHLGSKLKEQLERNQVNHDHVRYTPESDTGMAVISVDKDGQNTIVTFVGANAFLSKQDIDDVEPMLKQAKFAIMQMEMKQEVGEYLIQKAHQLGVELVLNLAPVVSIQPEVLQLVDLLIVNETEASQMTGIEVNAANFSEHAAQALFDKGIKHVIVTLGAKGAVLKTADSMVHYASPQVNAIDSTAAGDCFVAATTSFWCKDGSLVTAVQKAVEAASLSVTRRGAQSSLPTLDEYIEFNQSLGLVQN